MKIVVSYLKSNYDKIKTIKLINETSADGIHVDLMDGIYAGVKNFDIDSLSELFIENKKPLDVHLMVNTPENIIDKIINLKPVCIYIHPSTDSDVITTFEKLRKNNIAVGIAINPDENINDFKKYFPFVNRVLLMSVVPGKGGQSFLEGTIEKLKTLKIFQKENDFEIYVDGGINAKTANYVKDADGVVSGAFICMSDDFESQINKLRN